MKKKTDDREDLFIEIHLLTCFISFLLLNKFRI